jgi:hypothetical protein
MVKKPSHGTEPYIGGKEQRKGLVVQCPYIVLDFYMTVIPIQFFFPALPLRKRFGRIDTKYCK